MKIKSIHYQRNGVCGEPFFTVYFEDKKDLDFYGEMIATFRTTEADDNHIDRTTCRVICRCTPEMPYRGDNIADRLQREFNRLPKSEYGIYGHSENNKRITEAEELKVATTI